ncbi:MAG: hypothetical protein ACP5NG_03615, partial [Conexivisphaera sp.]
PIYLSSLGLGPLYIGLSVVLVVMGNVASNFVVGMLGGPRLRRSLTTFLGSCSSQSPDNF